MIISHYHGDHINGLLKADNSLAVPERRDPGAGDRAQVLDGRRRDEPLADQTHRRQFQERIAPRGNAEVLKRLRTYEWDKEVAPGVTAVGTPGHTPGHTSHVVSSGAAKVYVQADVTHVPFLFARHPGWHAFYDQDGAMAEATRRKVYDMLSAER